MFSSYLHQEVLRSVACVGCSFIRSFVGVFVSVRSLVRVQPPAAIAVGVGDGGRGARAPPLKFGKKYFRAIIM